MNLKLHACVLLFASASLGAFAQTPTRLSDINTTGDANPTSFFIYSNNLFFLAKPATDRQEWYSFNTENNNIIQNTNNHSQISGGVIFRTPVRIGNNIFVSSSENSTTPNLYFSRFDLTTGSEAQWNPNGTTTPSDPLSIVIDSASSDVYATFATSSSGNQIFKWNHTTGAVTQFSTIGSAGVGSNGNNTNGALMIIGNYIYTTSFGGTGNNLNYPIRISLSDGSTFTEILNSGNHLYDATRFTNVNGKLYFVARSGSGSGPVNLYCYDPSSSALTALTTYTQTLASGNVAITAINPDNTMFITVNFYNTSPLQGEMLRVNPTNNSVTHVNDTIQIGTTYAYAFINGTNAYFTQASGSNRILLQYNMTSGTTTTVVGTTAGFTAMANFFMASNGKAYFSGTTSTNGAEPWSYDLSNNTLSLIADIYSGTTGSAPATFNQIGNKLYFSAKDLTYGRELYSLQISAPLAIQLKSFTALNIGSINVIDWENASEEIGETMHLQASADGKTFHTIAQFQTSGNSNTKYEYKDEQPVAGMNYYRLATDNKNGSSTLSNVATAFVVTTSPTTSITLYPNPVTSMLYVNCNQSGSVSIINTKGTIELNRSVKSGSNGVDVSKLSSGFYLLEFNTGSQMIIQRFTKQ